MDDGVVRPLFESIAPQELEFEAVWRDYMLLETFDYLKLLTCYGFESAGCGPMPTIEGPWEQLSARPLGPSEVELIPFPFPGDRFEVEVECVHVGTPYTAGSNRRGDAGRELAGSTNR